MRQLITLDGPAGVGKSTVAQHIGDALGIPYLDTGAMFRCLAVRLGADAPTLPEHILRERCREHCIVRFSLTGTGTNSVLHCDGVPVGKEIRTEAVALLAAKLGSLPVVRDILKDAQQTLGLSTPLVVEGRDMGTVVFPHARHKFFLTADPDVRAQRRFLELEARGEQPDFATLSAHIRERDALDRDRAIAPLRQAPDAECIDTSGLTIDEVTQRILDSVAQRGRI